MVTTAPRKKPQWGFFFGAVFSARHQHDKSSPLAFVVTVFYEQSVCKEEHRPVVWGSFVPVFYRHQFRCGSGLASEMKISITATGVGAPAGLRPCTRAPQLAFAAAAKGGRVGKRGRINSFAINSSSRERSRGTSKAVPQRLFATTLRHIDFERKSRRQTKDYKESSTPTKVLRKDAGGVLESSPPIVVATHSRGPNPGGSVRRIRSSGSCARARATFISLASSAPPRRAGAPLRALLPHYVLFSASVAFHNSGVSTCV